MLRKFFKIFKYDIEKIIMECLALRMENLKLQRRIEKIEMSLPQVKEI